MVERPLLVLTTAILLVALMTVPAPALSRTAPTNLVPPTAHVRSPISSGSPKVLTPSVPSSPSPHPGTVDAYYLVPGGSFSEDPGVDYETVGMEPIVNVFQTLISYNGSLAGPYPTDYVPNLATCVPGSSLCTQLYGNTLQSGDNYTFVINPNAEFYNPSTKSSANVFPMDVLFSYVRTCMFADFPYGNPGWIQCQSLLPFGSSSYDSGLHYPYNSTPTNILNAIQINNTAFCPVSATYGCVTFDTQYSGNHWPDFLEFVADPLGGGIMDCNYAMSVGMSSAMPGFSCGAATDPTGIADTAWDGVSLGMGSAGSDYSGTSGQPVANWANTLRWSMVGSGPYYLSSLIPGTSYTVMTNPDWKGTTCSWSGCLPAAFPVNTVNMVWESNASEGEVALENGQADIATIPAANFSSVLLPLLSSGKANLTTSQSLSLLFTNFDMDFSTSGAQSLLPNGTTLQAPGDLLQDLAFRQFLTHAYPYATVQSQYNTLDGVPTYDLYGGAIPQGMANYYPTNISWDDQDPGQWPSGSPENASYWWAQTQSEHGIAAQACTVAKPCVFPLVSINGAAIQDKIDSAWVSDISNLSGGAVDAVPVDMPFINLAINSWAAPGQNPMPMYELGWVPDYPDPTDYVNPIYMPDNTFTYGDALCEALGMFTTLGCASSTNLAAGSYDNPLPAGWVWTNDTVTTATQGTAYTYMTELLAQAAFDMNLPERALLYNAAEHVAQQLGIFVPNPGQEVVDWVTASWLDTPSLDQNPLVGGVGDMAWYTLRYVQSGTPSGPTISAFAASSSAVAAGQTVYLNVTATGGTGPLSYAYTGLPAACTSANTSHLPCVSTSLGGPYTVMVTVTDSAQRAADAFTSFSVTLPGVGPTISSFTASPSSAPLGGKVYLNVTVSGGTGPLSYAYAGLPSPCAGANASQIICIPGAAGGPYTVTVTVSDSATPRHTATSAASFSVAGGSTPTIGSFTASPASIPLGGTTYLNVSVSGGIGPLTYSYNALPAGCTSANRSSLPCAPSASGSFSVTVTVTDSKGNHVTSGPATFTVTPLASPSLSGVAVSPGSASLDTGASTSFSAALTCTGGTCPSGATYAWSVSPGSAGSLSSSGGASVSFTAGSSAGTATLTVLATLHGISKTASASITISAKLSPPGNPGPSGNTIYLLIGALVAVVVVGAVVGVLLWRRRGRGPSAPVAPPPGTSAGQSEPPALLPPPPPRS